MSLDDQFEHGRIPLRPLSYNNKELAVCNEFIIDYGNDRNYHMYMSDPNDPSILIDLTDKIIKEILPNADINANQFQINIEGIKDPSSLQDIINFIYKRFTYADNPNGFDYERDIDKVFDPTTVNVLLRNTDGTILLPVTTIDNVYDDSGVSLRDRLDKMGKLGFGNASVKATENNQTQFEFEYPFQNYSDYIEVRIGTTYIDKSRYYITPEIDTEGNYTKGILVLIDESVEIGRRVDFFFIYNSITKVGDDKYNYLAGNNIVNNSIPSVKLEKMSDSFTLNDSSSVASSAAVYNLFKEAMSIMEEKSSKIIFLPDLYDNENTTILLSSSKKSEEEFIEDTTMIYTITGCIKSNSENIWLRILLDNYFEGTYNKQMEINYTIQDLAGNDIKQLPANKYLKLLLDNNNFIAYCVNYSNTKRSRLIHTCVDQETIISYAELDYELDDIINVYRNGVRLFEDLDYHIDAAAEKIVLYVRTEEGERIVFESCGTGVSHNG